MPVGKPKSPNFIARPKCYICRARDAVIKRFPKDDDGKPLDGALYYCAPCWQPTPPEVRTWPTT